jgi:tetratricopeptide (TPR) repeat protein/transcriptional regulator with XRE-family HTH domain
MVPVSAPSFGILLKQYRRAAGITQAQLAKRAGFATVFISMLERDVRRPLRATIAQLAAALEISAARRAALETAAHLSATKRVVVDNHLTHPRLASGGFLGAKPEGALVARDVELDRLRDIMAAVTAGAGRLVLLAGEPGVGKTRLAQEGDMLAREQGFLVITGCCYEQYSAIPYSPYIEALAGLYAAVSNAIHAETPGRWGELSRLLHDPTTDASDAADATASASFAGGREDQLRLFRQVSGFLQMLAEEQPVALFLDDLQWADQASIDLLRHLARHTRTSPILLLGAYRDDEVNERHPLEEALHEFAHDQLAERIHVRSLSFEGSRSLIAATLGETAASAEFARALYDRTEGNPFFTQEVVRALVESGEVAQHDGAWDAAAIKQLAIPEDVRSGIAQRFHRLSPTAQRILHEASILGQTFAFDDLQAMNGHSEAEIEAALEEGLSVRLLDEVDGDHLGFHHALIYEALYHDLTAHKRLSLHRRAGEAIERLPERTRIRRSADLAYHFRAAGARARALPYLLLAGDQAETVYAHTEAESFYRSAADVAREIGDQAQAAAALERLGGVQYFVARIESAMESYDHASQAYRVIGDVIALRRVTARLARILGVTGDLERGRALLQPLLDSSPMGEPAASFADMYIDLAWLCSNPEERVAACEHAAEIARVSGDNHILALAEFARANTLNGQLGRVEEARQIFEAIIPLLEASGDLRRLCSTYNVVADACMRGGEFGVASEWADRALDVTKRLGVPAQLASTYCNHGDVAFYAGEWRQAYLDYECAEATYRHADLLAESGYALWGMGQVCLARGQIREASHLLEEAITRSEPHANQDIEPIQAAHAALAERDLLAGRPESAYNRLERLVERLQTMPGLLIRVLPLLAWAHLDLSGSDRAGSLIQDAISRSASGYQRLVLVEALRIKGMIATRQKQWTEGEVALDEALALSQAMPYPYAEAKIHYTSGVLHLEHNQFKLALTQLQAARDVCKRLGERLYRKHIARRLDEIERS